MCRNATEILDTKYPSIKYEYYEYDRQPGGIYPANEVLRRNGASVLPQIYICKNYVGGISC